MKIYIDFESRSQADIWATGAWAYAEHPSTEILCLCVAIDDGPVHTLTRATMAKGVLKLNAFIEQGAEFHAHNAYFERCIWKQKITPIYGVLPIPIKQWRCTAAKAAANALPRSLENVCNALNTKNKKDKSGNTVMRSVCRSTGVIDQDKLERLYKYCAQDVEAERDVDNAIPDLSEKEQRVWFLDQYVNDTGVNVDIEAVKAAAVIIEQETGMLTEELNTLTGGAINKGTQTKAIRSYLERQGCDLPNLQKNTVINTIKNSKNSKENLRVLELRQQLSLTSNAKYKSILSTLSIDGRVRDIMVYHGASTGRWTGKLVQLQNLPRPTDHTVDYSTAIALAKQGRESLGCIYDNLLSVLSGCIRGMFIPTVGYEMFISDFAAIEARVVMWLADAKDGLEIFHQQDKDPTMPDIYVMMAREIYGKSNLTKKDKQERQLGKQAVLACGFGMGIEKFKATCKNYHIVVSDQMAERAVFTYRKKFKMVVQFWYALEKAAKRCIKTKIPQKVGKIRWFMEGDFLRMGLPSGRTLAYHFPKVNAADEISFMAVNGTTKKYNVERTWGGTLVENATQAVARDIMAEATLHMASSGYKILFTVHDELVVEAPIGTKTVDEVLQIQRRTPAWGKGCPINAECEKVMRYKK